MSVRGRDYTSASHRAKLAPQVRLIVVEAGTTGLVTHSVQDDADQTVVVVQMDAETPRQFAERVTRRVLVLQRANRIIERTTILLSSCFDAAATSARLMVVRSLLEHSERMRIEGLELILSAGSASRGDLQVGLPSLVDAFLGAPSSGAVAVGIELDTLPCGEQPRTVERRNARLNGERQQS